MAPGEPLPWIRRPGELLPTFFFPPELPLAQRSQLLAAAQDLHDPVILEARFRRVRNAAIVLVIAAVLFGVAANLGLRDPYPGIMLGWALMFAAGSVGSAVAAWNAHARLRLSTENLGLINPYTDLDEAARTQLTTAVLAAGRVAGSRVVREDRLPGWPRLVEDQLWRIVSGLKALSELRAMLREHASALPEQVAASQAAEQEIDWLTQRLVDYADSVGRVDRSLDVLDTVIHRDAIDERLRDALAITSGTSTAATMNDGVLRAEAEVDAALMAVRKLGQSFGSP